MGHRLLHQSRGSRTGRRLFTRYRGGSAGHDEEVGRKGMTTDGWVQPLFGIFLTPVFYYVILNFTQPRKPAPSARGEPAAPIESRTTGATERSIPPPSAPPPDQKK